MNINTYKHALPKILNVIFYYLRIELSIFCIEIRVRGRRELLAKFTKLSLEQIELTYLSHRKGNKKKNSFKTLIGSVSKKISGMGGRPPSR